MNNDGAWKILLLILLIPFVMAIDVALFVFVLIATRIETAVRKIKKRLSKKGVQMNLINRRKRALKEEEVEYLLMDDPDDDRELSQEEMENLLRVWYEEGPF